MKHEQMARFLKSDMSGDLERHWPWPTSFNSKMCQKWAERNRLVQVTGGHEWFVRFIGKTCVCAMGDECDLSGERALGLHDHPDLDHDSYWEDENGKQLLVVQPYSIDTSDIREWVDWADRHDLNVRISGESFYCPGQTLMIEITKNYDGVKGSESK
jgi:hypothetical protein